MGALQNFLKSNLILLVFFFFSFTFCVTLFSTWMTNIAISIKKKAKIPDSIIGGILIGSITSIPESISSLIIIFQKPISKLSGLINMTNNASSPIGDMLGSNMFCFFVLAICLLAIIKKFYWLDLKHSTTISTAFLIIGLIFTFFACFLDNNSLIFQKTNHNSNIFVYHGFNIWSIFILLSYIFGICFTYFNDKYASTKKIIAQINVSSKTNKIPPKPTKISWFDKQNIKLLVILLILSSIFLIASSMLLEVSSEVIISWLFNNENNNMIGARGIVIGIATSIPEIVVLISMMHKKEYRMLIDAIIGSCSFNLFFLFILNVSSAIIWQPGDASQIFYQTKDSTMLLLLSLLQTIFFMLYMIFNSTTFKNKLSEKISLCISATLLGFVIVIWFSYVLMTFFVI